MIAVEECELNLVLPAGDIGVVVMQPFVELCQSEPHRWMNGGKSRQIERVLKTLQIAIDADHTCDKTHFTVFPEYAIPGLEGIAQIEEVMEGGLWEAGTVILGGIDGLTKKEYSELCAGERTVFHSSNSPEKVRDDEWVNCAITWIKVSDGQGGTEVRRWLQPKLCPSWPEENVTTLAMFQGKCIYVFQALLENRRAFRFMSMVCYDWVGSLGSARGISAILQTLNTQWSTDPDGRPMHLVFILQNNPKPNHASFLSNTYEYFHGDYPFVDRDKGVVLFANSAGSAQPGPCESYGYTSLIFSSNSPYSSIGSPPSYAVHTRTLRGSDALHRHARTPFFARTDSVLTLFVFYTRCSSSRPQSTGVDHLHRYQSTPLMKEYEIRVYLAVRWQPLSSGQMTESMSYLISRHLVRIYRHS